MDELILTYEANLRNHMNFNVAVSLVILAIFLIIAVCVLSLVKDKKIALSSLIAGIVISLVVYFTSVLPYQMDISEKDYVVYTGEFYVEKHYSSSRTGAFIIISIPDEASIRYEVACDADEIKSDTSYYGTFVYGKRTKALVDIEID